MDDQDLVKTTELDFLTKSSAQKLTLVGTAIMIFQPV
jgi:hypothetical protein